MSAIAPGAALAGSYTLTTVVSFTGTKGTSPGAFPGSLTPDGQGGFLGTTEGRTINGYTNSPSVFQFNPATGAVKDLASFAGDSVAGLVPAGQGIFYGTATNGGTAGEGMIFRFNLATDAVTRVASFNGTNGSYPTGLVPDGQGQYLGTTEYGGASGLGTVFRFDPASGSVTTLASFTGTNGADPSPLVSDGQGHYFGTTYIGGTANTGTVFRFDPATGSITTLLSLTGPNGSYPSAPLVPDGRGGLLGTTGFGGTPGDGTIFDVDPTTGAVTTLASFTGKDGTRPLFALTPDGSGDFLGTTVTGQGAAVYNGTVFRFDPSTDAIATLANFVGINQSDPIPGAIGANPSSALVPDGKGDFFGTTALGGTGNFGTIYELSPVPEPSSAVLMALGMAGAIVVAAARRKLGAGAARS